MRICPYCGAENAPEARFCGNCGSGMESGAEPVEGLSPLQPVRDLQPRDLGGLLSETLAVYRSALVFILIALVSQIPAIVGAIIGPEMPAGTAWYLSGPLAGNVALGVVIWFLSALLALLAGATIVLATAQRKLSQPVNVGWCLSRVLRKIIPLIIAAILYVLILAGSGLLVLILIGIPLLFYFAVSLVFSTQAIMVEGKGPVAALGRSRRLVKGSWWRVFGIGIVFSLIMIGLGILLAGIPAIILGLLGHKTAADFLMIGVQTLLFPIPLIGATLFYFDLRIRKEGYTSEMMASEVNSLASTDHRPF